MARAHYYRVVQDAEGDIRTGLSVRVCDAGTSDAVAASVYAADSGVTELGNPFASDGVIDFYFTYPQAVNIEVTLDDESVVIFAYQSVGTIEPIVLTDGDNVKWALTVGVDGALTTTPI